MLVFVFVFVFVFAFVFVVIVIVNLIFGLLAQLVDCEALLSI